MTDSVGFRFRPTEEEIINHFLELKMRYHGYPFLAVKEVDILNYNPWDLPEQSPLPDDQVWYFFSAPSKKYANGRQTNRTTSERTGYWKITGRDREVKDKRTREKIGVKKTLVFYKGRNSPSRTSWVMHEFHSNNAASYQKEFVFCRLKLKFDDTSATLQHEASSFLPFNGGNHEAPISGSPVNRELHMELDLLDSGDEINEGDFSMLRSILHPEQDSSPSNGSNNESNIWSSQLDMSEQDDDFVNSLWSDDVQLFEETVHARPHGCNPTQPVRGVYVGDSSDSDTETLQAQFQFGDADLKEYRQMQKVRAPTETSHSSSLRRNKEGENSFNVVEILASTANSKPYMPRRLDLVHNSLPANIRVASAANSEPYMPRRPNLVHSSSPANIRACKAQPQPKSHNLVERPCAPKTPQLHGEGSRTVCKDKAIDIKEFAINLPQKGSPAVKLHEDQKMAETTKPKTNLKSRSTTSDGSNRKGSFIILETSPVNHEQIPPSVYVWNVVVGVVLLISFWEMVSLY